jgi:hypothetical protein
VCCCESLLANDGRYILRRRVSVLLRYFSAVICIRSYLIYSIYWLLLLLGIVFYEQKEAVISLVQWFTKIKLVCLCSLGSYIITLQATLFFSELIYLFHFYFLCCSLYQLCETFGIRGQYLKILKRKYISVTRIFVSSNN